MRYMIVALCVTVLAGCTSQGPGANCDPCAVAEANPTAGPAGTAQAAAAAASGGQRTSNAPFADDTWRVAPQTTVGRGAGNTSSNSADRETREVASGGALNAGVLVPNEARASTVLGGVPTSVQSAADTVASLRASLQVALADPETPITKIEWIGRQLVAAQQALAAAQAGAAVKHTTNNYFQHSRNTVTAVSTSKTGKQPGMEPEPTDSLAKGVVKVVEAGTAEYESTFPPPAPEEPETEKPAPEGP